MLPVDFDFTIRSNSRIVQDNKLYLAFVHGLPKEMVDQLGGEPEECEDHPNGMDDRLPDFDSDVDSDSEEYDRPPARLQNYSDLDPDVDSDSEATDPSDGPSTGTPERRLRTAKALPPSPRAQEFKFVGLGKYFAEMEDVGTDCIEGV